MKDIDPRLAPVVAAERGIGAFGAFLGGLMALLGGAFLAMALTKNGDLGGILIVAFFGLIFFVPGILMIRSWLRGPKAKASIRLLTVDRAELVGWDLQYVSINRGPARPRLVKKLFILDIGNLTRAGCFQVRNTPNMKSTVADYSPTADLGELCYR